MSIMRGNGRVAMDYAFWGAVVGFVVSVLVSVVMIFWSLRIDRRNGGGCMGCSCLLRMVALLVLTLGLGAGYLIGSSMMRG